MVLKICQSFNLLEETVFKWRMDKFWKYIVWLNPELKRYKPKEEIMEELERMKRDQAILQSKAMNINKNKK